MTTSNHTIRTTSHPLHSAYLTFLANGGTDGDLFQFANASGYYGESLDRAAEMFFTLEDRDEPDERNTIERMSYGTIGTL